MNKKIITIVIGVALLVTGAIALSELPDTGIKNAISNIFPAIVQGDGEAIWTESTEDFKKLLLENHGSKKEFLKDIKKASHSYKELSFWEVA